MPHAPNTRPPAGRPLALVTGASGGIGLDLAAELARRGHDLVLVARRREALDAAAARLRAEHGGAVAVVALDLGTLDAPERLCDALAERGLDVVDVLVNNAGFAQYGDFLETDAEQERQMLLLNVVTLTRLTKLLLPGMVARARASGRAGRVLNVASTAAFMPGPGMAVYYATKAYVLSFSEAIAEELAGAGVTVTTLAPGPTATGFQARADMHESKLVKGRAIMDAATVARAGVDALLAGRRLVIPGAMNRVQALTPRFLPRALVPGIVRRAQARASDARAGH